MAILVALVGVVTLCLLVVLVAWGIHRLGLSQSRRPVVPVTRQDESNTAKGRRGKVAVGKLLRNELPADDYRVFSKVRVPSTNASRSTTVDHVVVSPFGVFVVTTRAWPGLISPTRTPGMWKQQVGRKINKHPDPVERCDRAARTVAHHLNLRSGYVHGVVCFSEPSTRFAPELPEKVVHAGELTRWIRGRHQAVFNADGLARMTAAMNALT